MSDNFRTDKFHMERVQLEFIEAEVNARIKEQDFSVKIGGRKMASIIEFTDGLVSVDVETPVKFLEGSNSPETAKKPLAEANRIQEDIIRDLHNQIKELNNRYDNHLKLVCR